jgi:RNA polymerase sigma factor (sigma-70 family)
MQTLQPDVNTELHDGQLLAAFAQSGREALFEELVARHGTLVLNTCLRVLNQRADAEDATQAVFLALATKARDNALHARASLAGWLHTTALNTGLRARAALAARVRHEHNAAAVAEATHMEHAHATAAEWQRVAPLLDGELDALPEKYRLPIVLHHLDEQPIERIAETLSCSIDTIKQRLSRGREMLRDRLGRRGVNIAGALLPVLLQNHAASATLPFTFASVLARAAAAELTRIPVQPQARRMSRRMLLGALAIVLLGAALATMPWIEDSFAHATRVRVSVPPAASVGNGTPSPGTATSGAVSMQAQAEKTEVRAQTPPLQPTHVIVMSTQRPATNESELPKKPLEPREFAQKKESGPETSASGPQLPVDIKKFVTATSQPDDAVEENHTQHASRAATTTRQSSGVDEDDFTQKR